MGIYLPFLKPNKWLPCLNKPSWKILDYTESHNFAPMVFFLFFFFFPQKFCGLKNLVIFFQKKTKVSQIHTREKNKK
jgi:hypothetical protein